MSNGLEIFNEIINLSLRPWKVDYSNQKYQQLLRELKPESYQSQPLYDVAFIKPVNDKRKYYHALISNSAIKFLNDFHNEIQTAIIKQEKTHWVSTALDKLLKTKFADANNLIEKKKYTIDAISVKNDDAYIIQYLKYQLIRLYLEVQDTYLEEIQEDPLTQEDILANLFSDTTFDKPVIVHEERNLAPKQEKPAELTTSIQKFIQHNHEIREPNDEVLLYQEIVERPEALGRVEEILFEDEYIDQNLNFKEKKGRKLVIAAYAHVLKNRGVFKEITFHKGKRIKVSHFHIQRFISHRYADDFDQQYRRFKNKKILADFLDNNLWIK